MAIQNRRDIASLNRDREHGDILLCAQLSGTPKHALEDYLRGRHKLDYMDGKVAWRVFLAKIESNRAFWKAVNEGWKVINGEEFAVTQEAHKSSLAYLFRGDLAAFVEITKNADLVYRNYKNTNNLFESLHGRGLARAIILRARENRIFLDRIATWGITYEGHGTA